MPEFHAARAALSALEFLLLWRLWRGRHGALLGFGVCLWFEAVANALPYHVHQVDWPRRCFLLARTPLLFLVSFEVMRFLHGVTLLAERRLLLALGGLVGTMLVIAGFHWNNPSAFASATTVRQYTILALAAGFSAFWCFVRWIRPVDMPDALKRSHGQLWAIWLWAVAVMASTGLGGLARVVVDFASGQYWRRINSTCVFVQICLILMWLRVTMKTSRQDATTSQRL